MNPNPVATVVVALVVGGGLLLLAKYVPDDATPLGGAPTKRARGRRR